jgi:selenocysteine-specific elongation factor
VVLLDAAAQAEFDSLPSGNPYLISAGAWESLRGRMASFLAEYHQRYPLRSGMPREELKSRLGLPARAFNQAVALAASQGMLVQSETTLALSEHRVVLNAEQRRQVTKLLEAFRRNPYSPPTVSESEAAVGSEVLASLIEQGQLVKVSDTVLFSSEAYRAMTKAIVEHLQREQRITLAQVRDMFATSRKYAQALVEHLDDQRITKRVGDERMLR